jgi:hypothetical protein
MPLLDPELARLKRNLERRIENMTRQEFGFRRIGEGWVCETLLFQSVRRLLPDCEVIRHYRPTCLNGLELDVYVPALNLAFEYQGQQHFHPVKAWGGLKSLGIQKSRDGTKIELCKKSGIRLVHVNYYDPLTDDFIQGLISK